MVWLIVSFASLGIAGAFVTLFLVRYLAFQKTMREDHEFVEDELVEEKAGEIYEATFIPVGDAAAVIENYVLTDENGKCHLLCNYSKKEAELSMTVHAYDGDGNFLQSCVIKEKTDATSSSPLELPAETRRVNFVLNEEENGSEEKSKEIKLLILLETCALFFGLIPVINLLAALILGRLMADSQYAVMGINGGVALAGALLNYLLISRIMKRESGIF